MRRFVTFVLVRVRYLCVGGLCAASNWLLMLLIDHDRYVLSSALCFPLVGSLAYSLHARWTFRTVPSWRACLRYLIVILPGYPLSLGLLFALHDLAALPLAWAIPATTLIMLVLNFIVTKWTILTRGVRPPAARDVRPNEGAIAGAPVR